jgi:hypothetical protein
MRGRLGEKGAICKLIPRQAIQQNSERSVESDDAFAIKAMSARR